MQSPSSCCRPPPGSLAARNLMPQPPAHSSPPACCQDSTPAAGSRSPDSSPALGEAQLDWLTTKQTLQGHTPLTAPSSREGQRPLPKIVLKAESGVRPLPPRRLLLAQSSWGTSRWLLRCTLGDNWDTNPRSCWQKQHVVEGGPTDQNPRLLTQVLNANKKHGTTMKALPSKLQSCTTLGNFWVDETKLSLAQFSQPSEASSGHMLLPF